MFAFIIDSIFAIQFFIYERPYILSFPKDFWSTVSIEWLLLQSTLVYTYLRFIGYRNYYKQILALLWLLCVLAIYIAFLQLELFACFMFVAEFTIVIFFYTLFLHLQVATKILITRKEPYNRKNAIVLLSLVIFAAWAGWARFADKDGGLLFTELYKRIAYNAFSDLTFFAGTILRTNFTVHLLIGLFLLFLTLFLFFMTNVYFFLNITRRDAAKQSAMKVATGRGYYEQTAEEVQKMIKHNHWDH